MPVRTTISERDVLDLFDVSWASDARGLEHYLDVLLRRSARWFDATSASIFLLQESGEYVLAARTGRGRRAPIHARLRSGEGIAGRSIETGEPLLVTDPTENALLKGKVAARVDLGSSMIVPLATPESGCIGVVNLGRGRMEPAFTTRDLRHAKSFARHLALGVSNARLLARMNTAISKAKALHEKLGAVIDTLGVGVVVVNPFGEVTECNPEAVAYIGAVPNPGASWFSSLARAPSHVAEPFDAVITGALAGQPTRKRAYDPASDRSWSLTGSPMPDGGVAVAVHEITGHERAQRELSRLSRLAEIGQMTAAIAHEIRNPLTGIRSAAQFVRQNPNDAAEFGAIIEEEALKLNSLCDEFLEFARPLTLHVAPCSLGALIRHVTEMHRADFDAAHVALDVQIPDPEPKMIGDSSRIEQVCRNLVLNALQASRPGGTVTVVADDEGFVVRDEGLGMSDATIGSLFTPFFTTRPSGTGLGLSNVRKIVDAHGGEISVASKVGKGTTFSVRLATRKIA